MIRTIPLALALCATAFPAWAAEAEREVFGTLPDGREVAAVTLSNDNGMSVRILAYGALVTVVAPIIVWFVFVVFV